MSLKEEGDAMFSSATLADLPEFLFGHATDAERATGCTVVVSPEGAVCGVDVRGGGPATRETDLLRPENMIEAVHALVLAGGSAFGLEASCGVMDALSERGVGFKLENACVPIVSGACLFDLTLGENAHPDKAMGRAAVEAAFDGADFSEGNVGAGTGASVGKMLGGSQAMKTGFGFHVLQRGNIVVAALVALNAVGNVIGKDGNPLAGCRGADGSIMDATAALDLAARAMEAAGNTAGGAPVTNTTLGIIATNARLTKAQATKCSSIAHDAFARAIKPVHSSNDGDAIFTLASGSCEDPIMSDLVAVMATEAMQEAILRAALAAEGAYGIPAARDLI